MGIPFAQGLEMILDAHLNYTRGALSVYLRVLNFPATGDFIEVGLSYRPTGVDEGNSGFTDILILPPPGTKPMSYFDIGISGGRLQFGARKFYVSDTFVDLVLQTYPKIIGRYNVWRNWDGDNGIPGSASVVGIIYNNQLYSIVDIGRTEIAGKTINWILTCNSSEEYLEGGAQQPGQDL